MGRHECPLSSLATAREGHPRAAPPRALPSLSATHRRWQLVPPRAPTAPTAPAATPTHDTRCQAVLRPPPGAPTAPTAIPTQAPACRSPHCTYHYPHSRPHRSHHPPSTAIPTGALPPRTPTTPTTPTAGGGESRHIHGLRARTADPRVLFFLFLFLALVLFFLFCFSVPWSAPCLRALPRVPPGPTSQEWQPQCTFSGPR